MNSEFRNWTDIRIFLAVLRKGSTLAASRELEIAQPTVARRIDALEHELGLTLFERDTRGFRPTECALAILPDAEALEAAAKAFGAKVLEVSRPRPIRITGFSANFNDAVSAIFSEFSEQHPDVPLEFLPAVRVFDLIAGEADIAMRLAYSPQHPDLICRHVSTAQFTLYGAPNYAEKHGLPDSPEKMIGHTIFCFQRDDTRPITREWLLKHLPASAITRNFSEVGVLDAAIRAGHGLGMMNVRLATPDEKAGRLIRCFEPPEELNVPHMVVCSPAAYRRPEVRALLKHFTPRYAALYK